MFCDCDLSQAFFKRAIDSSRSLQKGFNFCAFPLCKYFTIITIKNKQTQTRWCTLNNRAAGKPMPAVTFDGAVVERTSSKIHWDADLQKTGKNNSTEVQERSVSPEGYGCKEYWKMPPLPTVSKCGAQCHWLRTRPQNNGTDKSAKAGQNAERGNMSQIGNHQGHTHGNHEVHARQPTIANQTESRVGQSILQYRRKSQQLTHSLKPWKTKRYRLGQGKSWMSQTEDSILQVWQLTKPQQTKEW